MIVLLAGRGIKHDIIYGLYELQLYDTLDEKWREKLVLCVNLYKYAKAKMYMAHKVYNLQK